MFVALELRDELLLFQRDITLHRGSILCKCTRLALPFTGNNLDGRLVGR